MKTVIKLLILILQVYHLQAGNQPQQYDVVVVGSGPAGYAAAFTTASKGYSTLIVQGEAPRGYLNFQRGLKNYPGITNKSGAEVMAVLEEQLVSKGASLSKEKIVRCNFDQYPFLLETSSGGKLEARAVILATGTVNRLLNVPGSDKYLNHGLYYKLDPNNPFWKGEHVAVVGSGEDAVSKALRLAQKASQVSLLVRGTYLHVPKETLETVLATKNITVFYNTTIDSIDGDGKKMSKVHISTRGEQKELKTALLLAAIGRVGNSELFSNSITCDEEGYVLLPGRTQETNIPGVFAAGAVADRVYNQGFTSAAFGMMAGYDVHRYFKNKK